MTLASDDATLVVVRGELDLQTAPALARALRAVAPAPRVLVDLDGVDFVDLSGLRPLLEFAFGGRPERRVSITAGSAAVRKLLELSGLGAHLDVVEPGR